MHRECRRVYYSGHVQGVGFRYTTYHVARGFDVTGFVRNLPDRRVELVVEGDPAEIDTFLQAVRDALGRHIREADVQTCPVPPNSFTDFTIRHD